MELFQNTGKTKLWLIQERSPGTVLPCPAALMLRGMEPAGEGAAFRLSNTNTPECRGSSSGTADDRSGDKQEAEEKAKS